jgi:hypothetical protein
MSWPPELQKPAFTAAVGDDRLEGETKLHSTINRARLVIRRNS